MAKKRTTPRQPNLTIYLGSGEVRERRLKHLDDLAGRYQTTRSVLIQKIAEGEIALCTPAESAAQQPQQ